MYYNMRVKTLQRNKADLLFRLETEKAVLQAEPKNRILKLYSAVKDVSTGLAVIIPRKLQAVGGGVEIPSILCFFTCKTIHIILPPFFFHPMNGLTGVK